MEAALDSALANGASVTVMGPNLHTDADVEAFKVKNRCVLTTSIHQNPTQDLSVPCTSLGSPLWRHYHRGACQGVQASTGLAAGHAGQ